VTGDSGVGPDAVGGIAGAPVVVVVEVGGLTATGAGATMTGVVVGVTCSAGWALSVVEVTLGPGVTSPPLAGDREEFACPGTGWAAGGEPAAAIAGCSEPPDDVRPAPATDGFWTAKGLAESGAVAEGIDDPRWRTLGDRAETSAIRARVTASTAHQ
jgi:hypothetical protein